MEQTMSKTQVGDYVLENQIGWGSFSTVWRAHHRVHRTVVAIKEIVMARLDKKLQQSLKSEIVILKTIDHPNIIRLHHMIEESGKIYIVLEYCEGGDLSVYIRKRQGRIPEATAKHFMRQLASGLSILRKNNLIHRDLKPQNLLLSTNDDSPILKIADFGFARSLQPRKLAETLCGSPLYMAPEIMQLQKYDAKADLWSVGAILFQLVTGRVPFTGNNHIQLLQNILKSTELQFPPGIKGLSRECVDLCQKLLRHNPVERLKFEEFFNHPFLSQWRPDETLSLNDDAIGRDRSPSFIWKSSRDGFPLEGKAAITKAISTSNITDLTDYTQVQSHLKEMELMESVDLGYVLVYGPPVDSSSSESASKLGSFPSKSGSPPRERGSTNSTASGCLPIISKLGSFEKLESHSFAPVTPEGSIGTLETVEQPSTDCMTRIKSLKRCASVITELVVEKIEEKKHLEAFSIQLVVLAIWKQVLDIFCSKVVSAIEGSPALDDTKLREIIQERSNLDILGSLETADVQGLSCICFEIERAFLLEVGNAEELANTIGPDGTEMPDAMELIYEAALDFGKHGAVKEYMGVVESAEVSYSKAVLLLLFLLVEAPSLILNPPFSLTNSGRYRLRSYIDHLNNRQSISRSQKMTVHKCGDQQCPPRELG